MRTPPSLRWLWKGWMIFSKALGIVMSTIILTLFWLIGIGFYAVIMKLATLLHMEAPKATYWLDASPMRPEGMKQQF